MCAIGFVKRILPFLATLAIGLFIASFFVDLATPQFEMRGRGWRRYQQVQQMKIEFQQLHEQNQQLQDENRRLRQQLSDARNNSTFDFNSTFDVPPPPPPPAPVVTRRGR